MGLGKSVKNVRRPPVCKKIIQCVQAKTRAVANELAMNSTKKLFGRKKGSVIKIRVWRESPKIRDLRERLLVGISILLKYFIMKFSRNVQPCKVWNETNQKYRRQYEIVFIIMIVLGKNYALVM